MSTSVTAPPAGPQERQGHRRRLLVGVGLVLVWFVALGVLGPLADKLTGIEKNNASSYLPKSAESTKSLALETEFAGAQTVPAIVVWERGSGLTAQDRDELGQAVARIGAVKDIIGRPTPLSVSKDGKAASTVVQLSSEEGFDIGKPVDAIRDAAQVEGLDPLVTGTGGLSADFSKAFEGIDGILLFTSGGVVLLLLLLVYRSPVFIPVLLSAVAALFGAQGVVYLVAKSGALTVNGQSSGILLVLVFGAGTDYALLLISRFKEELHAHESSLVAMQRALRGAVPPIVASGLTVVLGLLCLLLSDLASNKSLGPVAAIGIGCAMVAMLTFLPALLLLLGRYWFWPFVPRHDEEPQEGKGLWGRVSRLVGRRTGAVAAATAVLLLVLAGLSTTLSAHGITQAQSFTTHPDSVKGQEAFERHFPAGSGAPTSVIAPVGQLQQALRVVQGERGVASAVVTAADPAQTGQPGAAPKQVRGQAQILATLTYGADSSAAESTVRRLRADLDSVGKDVLVGGPTAITYDVATQSSRDNKVIIPAVLLVILVILVLLLRALVAPVLLVASVVLSFAATMGVCALAFKHVFHFAGADQSFPLFAFIFLVALGIDYNIFLMTRVREESHVVATRDGVLKGLAVTGGVITSAGLVLAATFSALGVLPIVFLAEIGFAVAFGVLLDTLLVRSLLVPAVVRMLGERTWWPLPLRREERAAR
ncbi:RND superfamily putative drug exporter [Motilibacter rhizosphaerae]|uniref:RND superfamily putative drug exporter n=1 Tax=Motilibacter rhizosphaerae TaxID=598652 RepID=A0A4Q7NR96_9ACTN|nr:MMPL family transporter [Motilibacter rhizosphaerae]RZS89593.1 RND superfamily putative drug exporter [Motilibacter rhizosphaerae]